MRYTIIIPAFNQAQLTRNCLQALWETTRGLAGGEAIVVDNASSDETPRMLEEFPWVRVIRNDANLGFAKANNQAAAIARGTQLLLLNNDTQALPGWLEAMLAAAAPDVGAVGARLLYPEGTLQHAGVVAAPMAFGLSDFVMLHDLTGRPGDDPRAGERREFQVVTGACLMTPRELYLELGGLDEGFLNGNEDVDYCLRVRERGLRVVYEPAAALFHFESRSGVARFRRAAANTLRLAQRWNGRVRSDQNVFAIERGELCRPVRANRGALYWETVRIPSITVVLHGEASESQAALERMIRANHAPVTNIVRCEGAQAVVVARDRMELRGDRYLAFVDARCRLEPGWLDELLRCLESDSRVAAATYCPEIECGESAFAVAADARCTLLAPRKFPRHHRLADLSTLDAALTDFLVRGLREFGTGVRGAGKPLGTLPPADPSLAEYRRDDAALAERIVRSRERKKRGLVSIVTLSWNAPQFTKLAIESIRAHTSEPYEIIVVDNGSGEETTSWLRTLTGVRVIFNAENRGFAGGNNQGFAAARGEYVVMLNNDVIVTEGWLDGLLDAFDRVPGLGVSAPRSNKVAGDQQLTDCNYNDIEAMHRYAAQRRARVRGSGYLTDRAIGLCLCIDRRVIDEVGGIDPRFAVGNFEDDDFCMRVRGAGYKIYVCNDVFIHHFGSQTFAANKVDWAATMHENWSKFAEKWGYARELSNAGYNARIAIAKGFDRNQHYVALPILEEQERPAPDIPEYRTIFVASVQDEADWNEVGPMVRKYLSALQLSDRALLSIAASGELPAELIGKRIERFIEKLGLRSEEVPDVEVSDEANLDGWLAKSEPARVFSVGGRFLDARADVDRVPDRSPSGLQRAARQAEPLGA